MTEKYKDISNLYEEAILVYYFKQLTQNLLIILKNLCSEQTLEFFKLYLKIFCVKPR